MRPASRFIAGVLVLIAVTTQHPLAQNCGCGLSQTSSLGSLRHIKWRIETNDNILISEFEQRVGAAAKIWNDEFAERSTQASLQKGTGDARIYVDKNLPAGQTFWDGPSKTLVFSSADWKDPTAPNDYIIAVLAHEFGHAFGFRQNTCPGESLMSDTSRSSYRTTFTTCDETNLTPFLGVAQDPEPEPDPEDDCTATNDCPDENGGGQSNDSGSPILIPLDKDPYRLTSPADGVLFDLDGDGRLERIAWTAVDSADAWLALDRNGNGFIDDGSELFGNFTPQPPADQPHGFLALGAYDTPSAGGNGDGWIDASDGIYSELRLWRDVNHDGVSQFDELRTMSSQGVKRFSLDYRESRRQDHWGNVFRYRAKIEGWRHPWAYDVFLKIASQ